MVHTRAAVISWINAYKATETVTIAAAGEQLKDTGFVDEEVFAHSFQRPLRSTYSPYHIPFDVLRRSGCFDFVSYPADGTESERVHPDFRLRPTVFQQDLPRQNSLWIFRSIFKVGIPVG